MSSALGRAPRTFLVYLGAAMFTGGWGIVALLFYGYGLSRPGDGSGKCDCTAKVEVIEEIEGEG